MGHPELKTGNTRRLLHEFSQSSINKVLMLI